MTPKEPQKLRASLMIRNNDVIKIKINLPNSKILKFSKIKSITAGIDPKIVHILAWRGWIDIFVVKRHYCLADLLIQ